MFLGNILKDVRGIKSTPYLNLKKNANWALNMVLLLML